MHYILHTNTYTPYERELCQTSVNSNMFMDQIKSAQNKTTCLPCRHVVLYKQPGDLHFTRLYTHWKQSRWFTVESHCKCLGNIPLVCELRVCFLYCLQLWINECKLVAPPMRPDKQVIKCDEALLEGRRGEKQGRDRKGRVGGEVKEERRGRREDAVWRKKTL